jgi:hypothetical protein
MRKSLILSAALVLSQAGITHAQTADDVIEKHLAAMGGRAALGKLTSRTVNAVITLSTPGGDVSGSLESYNKVPNKARTVIKIDLSSFGVGQVLQDQRFNGTTGYAIDTLNGNREMTGDQLEIARSSRFPSPLLNYKDSETQVELLGKEQTGSREAYVLRVIPKTGPASRMFFDAENYLLVKTVLKINIPQLGQDVDQTVEYSDYRDVDGVKVPYRMRSVNAVQTLTIVASKVEHNADIDERSFSKPAE